MDGRYPRSVNKMGERRVKAVVGLLTRWEELDWVEGEDQDHHGNQPLSEIQQFVCQICSI